MNFKQLLQSGLLLLMVGLFAGTIDAQTIQQYREAELEARSEKNWTKALALNKVMLEIDSMDMAANYNAGEAARNLLIYYLAETYYRNIPAESRTGLYALTNFHLGQVMRGQEQFQQAIEEYETFLAQDLVVDPSYTERAQREIDNLAWAIAEAEKDYPEPNQFGQELNTCRTDIAARAYENEFYYTTAYQGEGDKEVLAIYQTDAPGGILEPMFTSELSQDSWNANAVLSPDGNRMYYTVCNRNEEGIRLCDIYYRDRAASGWGPRTKMNNQINQPGCDNTQPAIGTDLRTGNPILFFSTNREGGKGNMDIWYSMADASGNFGAPVNLAAVNTPENDETPFFDNETNTLYFSSAGHIGLGAMDIYSSRRIDNRFAPPVNLGGAVNSTYDDTYYSYDTNTGRAYFSSNRMGSICDQERDLGCVCSDVYWSEIRVDLEVLTFNELNGNDLMQATVKLMDTTTGELVEMKTNPTGNDFYFPLMLNRDYQVIASRDEFTPADTILTTRGITQSTTIKRELYLMPPLDITVEVYNELTGEPLPGATVTLTNNSGRQTPQVVPNAATYQLTDWNINYNDRYTVEATKTGFSADSESFQIVDSMIVDGAYSYLYKLYLAPYREELFPVTLYFHNDRPGPRSRAIVSPVDYMVSYDRYYARRAEYVSEYPSQFSGDRKTQAEQEVMSFFDGEVRAGAEKLTEVTDLLIEYLGQGQSLRLEIEAYASSIAKSDYNYNLSRRRIDSVRKYFRSVRGGALQPYFASGALEIVRVEPKGDIPSEQAGITGDPNDRRNSVFSPAASRFRKVEILRVGQQTLGGLVPTTGETSGK